MRLSVYDPWLNERDSRSSRLICSYTNSTIRGGFEYEIMALQCSQLEAELVAWEFVGWTFSVVDNYNRL